MVEYGHHLAMPLVFEYGAGKYRGILWPAQTFINEVQAEEVFNVNQQAGIRRFKANLPAYDCVLGRMNVAYIQDMHLLYQAVSFPE